MGVLGYMADNLALPGQRCQLLIINREQDFSVTNMLCKTVLSLPMHTELTNESMDYISNTILDFIND